MTDCLHLLQALHAVDHIALSLGLVCKLVDGQEKVLESRVERRHLLQRCRKQLPTCHKVPVRSVGAAGVAGKGQVCIGGIFQGLLHKEGHHRLL